MEKLLEVYKREDFNIIDIQLDDEFFKVMDLFLEIQDPPIEINYAAAQEIFLWSEHNNCFIQKRVQSAYQRFTFTHLPRIFVKYLIMESTKKLGFFINKNGVLKYFSPRMIIHQENLDYGRHCKYQIGEYVQAHYKPQHKNTNFPRSLGFVYLHPMETSQGGPELLHLQTNKVVEQSNLKK